MASVFNSPNRKLVRTLKIGHLLRKLFHLVYPNLPDRPLVTDLPPNTPFGAEFYRPPLSSCSFLKAAYPLSPSDLNVYLAVSASAAGERFWKDLAAQDYVGPLHVTIFGPTGEVSPVASSLQVDICCEALPSQAALEHFQLHASKSDLVVFLTQPARLDRSALRRFRHLLSIDDRVVMPLRGLQKGERSLLSLRRTGPFEGPDPFMQVPGLNFAIAGRLLHRIGGLDSEFLGPFEAGRELAYRAWIGGGRFVPVTLPYFADFKDLHAPQPDGQRLRTLCPTSSTQSQASIERSPRISICIAMTASDGFGDVVCSLRALLRQRSLNIEIRLAHSYDPNEFYLALPSLIRKDARLRLLPGPPETYGTMLNRAAAGSRAPFLLSLAVGGLTNQDTLAQLLAWFDKMPEAVAVICTERKDIGSQIPWHVLVTEPAWPHAALIRRGAWENVGRWEPQVQTAIAVFHDMLLKLSEIGPVCSFFHGSWQENIPLPSHTTSERDTLKGRLAALKRTGRERYYKLRPTDMSCFELVRREVPFLVAWPTVRSNPYQRLLYASAAQGIEICEGDIDTALSALRRQSASVIFHLHWTTEFWRDAADEAEARRRVDSFLDRLSEFSHRGGRIVWTLHNVISHDSRFPSLEIALSRRLVELAHRLHLHSEGSVPEIEKTFALPREKIRISRHGSYRGAYPDFVSRRAARKALELDEADDVILFTGQLRGYKGVKTLISAFRDILTRYPRALLLIAGDIKTDPFTDLVPALTEAERTRIRVTGRFIGDMELQLYFRAADVAVYPYRRILTSGSLLLALSFGVPVVIPEVGMTREVLGGRDAGVLYDGEAGEAALIAALEQILARKRAGNLNAMVQAAEALADELDWPDLRETVLNEEDGTWA